MPPKISVITAVFNNEKSIRRAIESVLNQNYQNLEYIVVDGGSTDRTLSIINEYRSKIHCLISEKDRGIYDALNKGIAAATGEVVGFLHSDDEFDSPLCLESIGHAFVAHHCDGVYSDLQYVRGVGIDQKVVRYWKSCDFDRSLLKQGWMPPHPTLYLKKSLYQDLGSYNLKYSIAADYDFILRAFGVDRYRFHYLPAVTVNMQLGGASNRNLKKIAEKSAQDRAILLSHGYSANWVLFQKNVSKIKQFLIRKDL